MANRLTTAATAAADPQAKSSSSAPPAPPAGRAERPGFMNLDCNGFEAALERLASRIDELGRELEANDHARRDVDARLEEIGDERAALQAELTELEALHKLAAGLQQRREDPSKGAPAILVGWAAPSRQEGP